MMVGKGRLILHIIPKKERADSRWTVDGFNLPRALRCCQDHGEPWEHTEAFPISA